MPIRAQSDAGAYALQMHAPIDTTPDHIQEAQGATIAPAAVPDMPGRLTNPVIGNGAPIASAGQGIVQRIFQELHAHDNTTPDHILQAQGSAESMSQTGSGYGTNYGDGTGTGIPLVDTSSVYEPIQDLATITDPLKQIDYQLEAQYPGRGSATGGSYDGGNQYQPQLAQIARTGVRTYADIRSLQHGQPAHYYGQNQISQPADSGGQYQDPSGGNMPATVPPASSGFSWSSLTDFSTPYPYIGIVVGGLIILALVKGSRSRR